MSPTFLEDQHAIEPIFVRDCQRVDARQFDHLGDCFIVETAHDDRRALPGVEPEGLAPLIASMHWNLGDGSHRGVGRHEGALYSMWGLYDDELVRTSPGWRVAHRIDTSVLTEGPVVTVRDDA